MQVRCTGQALRDARGFTLVELLVVLLLLGILAMIALPSFIGQRAKGQDSEAESMVRTAHTALRTYEMDHDTFDATRADLEEIEPAIGEASAAFDVVDGTTTTFTIIERSDSDTVFTLTRDGSGRMTRGCSPASRGLCRSAVDADGNRW